MKSSRVSWTAICCLAFLGSANSAQAAGFRLPNQDAFATSRGSAFVATASNASAVYYNAAGLTQLEVPELRGGSYLINFGLKAETSAGTFQNTDKWQPAPQIFYAHPGETLSWGVGLYSPFGLGNEWPGATPFQTVTRKARIEYVTLAPVMAWEASSQLSLAAGLTLNRMKADVRQGVGLAPGDEITFLADDTAVGYTLSAHWKPSEKHYFGVNFRSHAEHNLQGVSNVSFVPTEQDSSLRLAVPEIFLFGYSFRPNPSINMEVNLEWAGWGRLNTPVLKDTALGDVPFPFEWQDGWIYEFGFTKTVASGLQYSIGYDYNESVQNETYYNPAVGDSDSHWLNLGVAKEGEKWQWALAYQHGISSRRVTFAQPNLAGETANGEYELKANSLQFSLSRRF